MRTLAATLYIAPNGSDTNIGSLARPFASILRAFSGRRTRRPPAPPLSYDTAYANKVNFNMMNRLADNVTDVPGYGHRLKNNLGYKGQREVSSLDLSKSEAVDNSFNGIPVSDKDFVSLDETQLTRPRQPNGGLPEISFVHLAPGCKLIDHGTLVGLPFLGAAPDLGAFEYVPVGTPSHAG